MKRDRVREFLFF